jgi:hypothetical protein
MIAARLHAQFDYILSCYGLSFLLLALIALGVIQAKDKFPLA